MMSTCCRREPYRPIVVAALVCALLVLAGCGSATPLRIQGSVTFNGEPVDGGAIVFYPIGTDAYGKGGEILGGKYVLEGDRIPKPGQHRVEVTWNKKTGRTILSNDPPNKIDETIQVIPKQFNGVKSTLTVEIQADKDTYDFPLTAK